MSATEPLRHLRASTANKRPTPAAMADGQLALNTNNTSPGLFFKDSNGALVKVGPVHVGTTAPNASPAVGGSTGNAIGEQWLDTAGGTYVFKVWDGSAWRSESGTFVDVNGDVMTGALGIIAGSAGSPGLYFSGDTNTGLYSPGADQLAISTNGTGRLFVDSNGRVGIGTASPSYLLHLNGTSNIESRAATSGASSTVQWVAQNTTGATVQIGAAGSSYSPYGILGASNAFIYTTNELAIATDGANSIKFATGTGIVERMRLDSSGRLGVGTSSPPALLSVHGTGPQLNLYNSGTGSLGANFHYNGTTGNLGIATNGVNSSTNPQLLLDLNGKLGIGTSSPTELLDIDADGDSYLRWERDGQLGGYGFATNGGVLRIGPFFGATDRELALFSDNSGNSWVTTGTAQSLFLGTNKTARVTIAAGGNVGIGTTSPGSYTASADNLVISDSGACGLTIVSPTTSPGTIAFADGTTGNEPYRGYIQYDHNSDSLAFAVIGNEAFRVDSSKRLLVGTSSETEVALFSVQGYAGLSSGEAVVNFKRGASNPASGTTLAQLRFTDSASNRGALISAATDGTWASGSYPGRLVFSTTADGASSPTERMRLTSTGQLRLAGAGITFNGDTATANELDDYEEGTWTPEVTFGGSSTGITYNSRQGRYTKVGNLVTLFCLLELSSKGTSAGSLRIFGIPFTTTTAISQAACYFHAFDTVTPGPLVAAWGSGNNWLEIKTAGTDTDLTNTGIQNNTKMRFVVTYMA